MYVLLLIVISNLYTEEVCCYTACFDRDYLGEVEGDLNVAYNGVKDKFDVLLYKMQTKKKIVHIVTKDKFSVGYINFMKKQMHDYEHAFSLVSGNKNNYNEDELIDKKDIYYYKNNCRLLTDSFIKENLSSSDKIIIIGLFGSLTIISLWPKQYLRKTYIQLWGADFYCLRNKRKDLIHKVTDYNRLCVFKRVSGIVF